jgi:hypothetical protein
MKSLLVLAICLIFAGCKQRQQENRDLLGKLETIRSELASNRVNLPRWALANRSEIESAVNKWRENKIERSLDSEALSIEEAEKLRSYEALENQLGIMQQGRAVIDGRIGSSIDPATGLARPFKTGSEEEKRFEAMRSRVAEARFPIEHILKRRQRQAALIRQQYSAEQLTAEYAKDRFDLVIDSSNMAFHILYSSTAGLVKPWTLLGA